METVAQASCTSGKFVMQVWTMASAAYSKAITNMLDPTNSTCPAGKQHTPMLSSTPGRIGRNWVSPPSKCFLSRKIVVGLPSKYLNLWREHEEHWTKEFERGQTWKRLRSETGHEHVPPPQSKWPCSLLGIPFPHKTLQVRLLDLKTWMSPCYVPTTVKFRDISHFRDNWFMCKLACSTSVASG